jgi:hypothetical protein
LPSTQDFGESFGRELLKTKELSGATQAGGSGLTLHFDELSVLNLSKEAALLPPVLKDGACAAERVNKNRKELKKFKGEQGVKRIFCGPRVQGRERLKLTNKRSVWYLLLLS